MIYRYHVITSLSNLFLLELKKNLLYISIMGRKSLSTRIEKDLQKEIKKLAIDLEKPLNDLLEEAIQDLLKKYEKKGRK